MIIVAGDGEWKKKGRERDINKGPIGTSMCPFSNILFSIENTSVVPKQTDSRFWNLLIPSVLI